MRLISLTPSAMNALASATMSACVRLRCEPRIRGMMQKLHGWLQPSAIFKYAKYLGVRRKRGVAKSGMKTGREVTSRIGDCGLRIVDCEVITVFVLPNFSEPRRDSS